MANAYYLIALVLWLSGLSAAFYVALRTNRLLHEHLQSEQNAYHQLLRQMDTKPPSQAGKTFVLSDREMAKREQLLTASSRARAAVLAADAHQKLTRTFRRGSSPLRGNSQVG